MLSIQQCVGLILIVLSSAVVAAQEKFEFWPNANYDPAIPTFDGILGYAPGERITWHRDAVRYFEALQKAAPGRVRIGRYGESWEGRDLIYVVLTSAENMSRIDLIKSGMQGLADPSIMTRAEAEALIPDQPAVTWLSYGVHGNEISSTDASMLTAYHLLASRGDARVADIMRDTVVVLDPMQNPDGRDRFIHHFEMAEGIVPDADRISAEHDEPWPGGRTNHYLFDLNRDWFILTQPETRGRVKLLQEWFPVAYVDVHEMGSDGTYYFPPEANPYNPHLAANQRKSLELFGRTNARWFDRLGIDYFTREVYDAFYPGYGASWPSYFGSIAMTFEQASTRGLKFRQYDGNEVSYAYTVRNHFVTSMGTAETVQANREKFLSDFYDYQVTAIDEGQSDSIRSYIIPTQADQPAANKLAGLLVQQGVDVGRATESFRVCGVSYRAGSYVVNTSQPAKRLIRTLLDIDVPIEQSFLDEQERRRNKNIKNQIYDVTAWSMPLMMNVETHSCSRAASPAMVAAGPEIIQPGSVTQGSNSVAYLIPWGTSAAVRLLANALSDNIKVKSSDLAFTHEGIRYPSGTLIIDVADNRGDLATTLADLSISTGADVVAVDDTWVTDGPNFGSRNVVRFSDLKVAIAWDRPTVSLSAGSTRFVVERQFGFPLTAIRTSRMARSNLSQYHVILLPESRDPGYAAVLGERGIANLKDWVAKGGVLIGIGRANRFLADPKVNLLSMRREDSVSAEDESGSKVARSGDDRNDRKNKGDSDGNSKAPVTVDGSYLTEVAEYEALIRPKKESPDSVAGVLVRADVDSDHWLGAGVASPLNVLVRGPDIYTPVTMDKGVNVARFQGPNELLLSGYMWEQNKLQLAYKPFVVAEKNGSGFVIGFTQDPNARAYLDGLNIIFMNAIFRGSAHARPLR